MWIRSRVRPARRTSRRNQRLLPAMSVPSPVDGNVPTQNACVLPHAETTPYACTRVNYSAAFYRFSPSQPWRGRTKPSQVLSLRECLQKSLKVVLAAGLSPQVIIMRTANSKMSVWQVQNIVNLAPLLGRMGIPGIRHQGAAPNATDGGNTVKGESVRTPVQTNAMPRLALKSI